MPLVEETVRTGNNPTAPILRLDREHAGRPYDDVVHVAASIVHIIDDGIPERLELAECLSDLGLTTRADEPRFEVEAAALRCEIADPQP